MTGQFSVACFRLPGIKIAAVEPAGSCRGVRPTSWSERWGRWGRLSIRWSPSPHRIRIRIHHTGGCWDRAWARQTEPDKPENIVPHHFTDGDCQLLQLQLHFLHRMASCRFHQSRSSRRGKSRPSRLFWTYQEQDLILLQDHWFFLFLFKIKTIFSCHFCLFPNKI